MPRSAGIDLTQPIDVTDPRFLHKIQLTHDVVQDVFRTLRGLMTTLNKTIAKGVDYAAHLQQIVDTVGSFADMTTDEAVFSNAFAQLRRAIECQKDLLKTLISWETRIQMDLTPHTAFFEGAAKKYSAVQSRFSADLARFVKGRLQDGDYPEFECLHQKNVVTFCAQLNLLLANLSAVVQNNGFAFLQPFAACFAAAHGCFAPPPPPPPRPVVTTLQAPTPTLRPGGGLLFCKGTLCPNGRNYLTVQGGRLLVVDKRGEHVVTDVVTLLAKPQPDEKSFELITPAASCLVHAPTRLEAARWLALFEQARNSGASFATEGALPGSVLRRLWSVDGNARCAECGKPDPDWVSLTLGLMLCLECSGAHRSLGVGVSRVKSFVLDHIDGEAVEIVLRLGNAWANRTFQSARPGFLLSENATGSDRYVLIREKYCERKFMAPLRTRSVADAVRENDARAVVEAALCCDERPGECLVEAARRGNVAAVVLMVLNGWSIDAADADGNTCLHIAVLQRNDRLGCVLLRYAPDPTIRNKDGKTALMLAEAAGAANMVSLLRAVSVGVDKSVIEDLSRHFEDEYVRFALEQA